MCRRQRHELRSSSRMAANNATAVVNAINMTTDEGNGTPTGDAINASVTYLKTLTSTKPKYILLATDGEPSCAGTPQHLGHVGAPLRRHGGHDRRRRRPRAGAGFHVFVLGVATTKTNGQDGPQPARHRGAEPTSDTRPGATVSTSAATRQALPRRFAIITERSPTCIFPLQLGPAGPRQDRRLRRQRDEPRRRAMRTRPRAGNTRMRPNDHRQVFGAWCDMIKTQGANTVQIIYGCPLIDVP